MRALRQQNLHTGVDVLTQAEYDAITAKDISILYIIVSAVAATGMTIQNVYVGTIPQIILVDNANNIVFAQGVTATLSSADLINLV